MKKPNFFIIGAPKCGTTSLAAWLSEHPEIFMSHIKEPQFFNTDVGNPMKSRQAYENLFNKAADRHIAVGEATVLYLYSKVAVKNILDYNPAAKFIVCLRNPVDMAYSLHEQLFFNGVEDIKDFPEAWSAQERRKLQAATQRCNDPNLLFYGPICRLGEQVKRLLDSVSVDRCLFIALDDLKANPRHEYTKILDFLRVKDDGRTHFPLKNPAKVPKSHIIRQLIIFSRVCKEKLGLQRRFGILTRINQYNVEERARVPMSAEMRAELVSYFEDDITLLGQLLKRDFSNWTDG